MIFSPIQFLAVLIFASLAARIAFVIVRNRRRRVLQQLARDWRMHYSPHDRFDLADKVAARFPVYGAAEMKVADLIYGSERTENGEFYRYIFVAEYTTGVTRGKHRYRRVATFREQKGKPAADWSKLTLAPEELPVIEQYQSLRPAEIKT